MQDALTYKLFVKLSRKVLQSIVKHNLLEANDKVLIAVSGGKDSLVLAKILAEVKRHLNFRIELFAVHVHLSGIGYKSEKAYLSSFFEQLDIPLIWKEGNLDLDTPDKSPCFICSWTRRKHIFDLSKELSCNKIAFGHHQDDAVQTMLLNMVNKGTLSSFPHKLSMFEGRAELIRPLLCLKEKDVAAYATSKGMGTQGVECPHGNGSQRAAMKGIVKQMEQLHKHAIGNLFRSPGNIKSDYIAFD